MWVCPTRDKIGWSREEEEQGTDNETAFDKASWKHNVLHLPKILPDTSKDTCVIYIYCETSMSKPKKSSYT